MTITPIKSLKIFAFALFAVFGSSLGLVQALDIDWKLYGGTEINGVSHNCFYDASGVVKQTSGHLRVWTKCLLENDIDNIDATKGPYKKIIENTAQKIARLCSSYHSN